MPKKLRIAIDGNEANVLQRVGSNAYAFELLTALEKITQSREDVEVTVLLAAKPHDQFPNERKGWIYRSFGPRPFWTQWALPVHLFLHKKNYDVFFTPGHYAPRISSVPYVSSIMDLAFLHFPKQFKRKDYVQLKEWTRYSVQHAKKIIAISEATKQDIVEQYHLKPEKIIVAYPGIQSVQRQQYGQNKKKKVLQKLKVSKPFILYIGTLQPRKNLLRLIEAFEKIDQSMQIQLVIAGKVGWLADEILDRVKKSPLKDKIILTGYVTELQKNILLEESVCTVLVGLYEGFGIPALEAMAHGSIPVVSNTTSLPEVVGVAGIQVDPYHVDEITAALERVVHMKAKEKGNFLKKGREQVKKFSWESAAEKVLGAIEGVV